MGKGRTGEERKCFRERGDKRERVDVMKIEVCSGRQEKNNNEIVFCSSLCFVTVSLSLYRFIYPSIYLCQSPSLSIYLSTYLSIYPSIHLLAVGFLTNQFIYD